MSALVHTRIFVCVDHSMLLTPLVCPTDVCAIHFFPFVPLPIHCTVVVLDSVFDRLFIGSLLYVLMWWQTHHSDSREMLDIRLFERIIFGIVGGHNWVRFRFEWKWTQKHPLEFKTMCVCAKNWRGHQTTEFRMYITMFYMHICNMFARTLG